MNEWCCEALCVALIGFERAVIVWKQKARRRDYWEKKNACMHIRRPHQKNRTALPSCIMHNKDVQFQKTKLKKSGRFRPSLEMLPHLMEKAGAKFTVR